MAIKFDDLVKKKKEKVQLEFSDISRKTFIESFKRKKNKAITKAKKEELKKELRRAKKKRSIKRKGMLLDSVHPK
ncbi:hypothetical protein CWI36_0337p0060 [Hamiltosporidium magnivora]|uniref:Uncharacterized protein n=1 Tax=Hamiltosporidium magnivora TaxID=148818 RepID=A0A4Q9LGC1_9MICR|nr:hypothetical protein CWI36_0337p0060 [Hamiltosporidium magnivora]